MDGTRNIEPGTVTRTMTLQQIDSTGDSVRMLVDFSYDARDPYAVSLQFVSAEPAVSWTFSRDLLMDGLFEPCGDGDVHVCPSLESTGQAVVLLELVGPEGEALIEVRSRDLAAFVDQMQAAVPQGTELEHLHVDDEIAAILSLGE